MSEDNEPMVRTIFSYSASNFDFVNAGISGRAASKNLECRRHLKEDKGKKDMKIKNCMKAARRIYI